jgi:hypothetical protein
LFRSFLVASVASSEEFGEQWNDGSGWVRNVKMKQRWFAQALNLEMPNKIEWSTSEWRKQNGDCVNTTDSNTIAVDWLHCGFCNVEVSWWPRPSL